MVIAEIKSCLSCPNHRLNIFTVLIEHDVIHLQLKCIAELGVEETWDVIRSKLPDFETFILDKCPFKKSEIKPCKCASEPKKGTWGRSFRMK